MILANTLNNEICTKNTFVFQMIDKNKRLLKKKSLSLGLKKHYDVTMAFQADEDNRAYQAQLCIKHYVNKLFVDTTLQCRMFYFYSSF